MTLYWCTVEVLPLFLPLCRSGAYLSCPPCVFFMEPRLGTAPRFPHYQCGFLLLKYRGANIVQGIISGVLFMLPFLLTDYY